MLHDREREIPSKCSCKHTGSTMWQIFTNSIFGGKSAEKDVFGSFSAPKCFKNLSLEPLWHHVGVSLGALLSPRGLHRVSLEALQERLGTSLGHLEAPGVDLEGFVPPKPPKILTVVGIDDAAS